MVYLLGVNDVIKFTDDRITLQWKICYRMNARELLQSTSEKHALYFVGCVTGVIVNGVIFTGVIINGVIWGGSIRGLRNTSDAKCSSKHVYLLVSRHVA